MIKVHVKFDTKKLHKQLSRTEFQRVALLWGKATGMALEYQIKKRAPRGRTGHLSQSITHRVVHRGNVIAAQAGTNVKYAIPQEYGSGLHGPHKHLIRPRVKKVLRWENRGRAVKRGKFVYAKWTRGVRPVRFVSRGLKAEQPIATRRLNTYIQRELRRGGS